jgi:ectoine hydroxylase-related dioxygenase (phytanoyl-CoA dioxygenase family)
MVHTETGWHVFENVLAGSECDELLDALASVASTRAGARHLMRNAAVCALALDERLLMIVRSALGESAVPYWATLFAKTGRANWLVVWHQDTALPLTERFEADGWGPWSLKEGIHYAHAPTWVLQRIVALRIHLDDCTTANGPLRVIPGSHLQGVLSDEEVSLYAREQAAIECLVGRGGVLTMSPLLIHASSKAQTDAPRRVLHIEYADDLALAENIHLAIA